MTQLTGPNVCMATCILICNPYEDACLYMIIYIVCICIFVYVYVQYIHTLIYIYKYVYKYIYIYIYTYMYIYICILYEKVRYFIHCLIIIIII